MSGKGRTLISKGFINNNILALSYNDRNYTRQVYNSMKSNGAKVSLSPDNIIIQTFENATMYEILEKMKKESEEIGIKNGMKVKFTDELIEDK